MHLRLLCGISLLFLCSACDRKAEGQTIAVINDDEITASELNAELAGANLPKDADKSQARSRTLQALIDRRLLAAQARADGLDRTPEFISRERRVKEDLLIGMLVSRQMATSKLPVEAEIAAIQARQPQSFAEREIWSLEQLQYETPRSATVGGKILQSKTLDEIARTLTESGVQFQRGRNQINTSLIPADMYPRLDALALGEPFIVPNGVRSLASVIVSREPAPLVGPAARTEAVGLIRRQSSKQLLEKRLKDLRQSAKIEYKEGFAPKK